MWAQLGWSISIGVVLAGLYTPLARTRAPLMSRHLASALLPEREW